jgi:hypothetical protein
MSKEQKQYLSDVSRKSVYSGVFGFALFAVLLFLFVPHYKPLKYADAQTTTDEHRAIIQRYFVKATTCKDDDREQADRIKTFNKYFKTNQFANRAVYRECGDRDVMLAKNEQGKWVKTGVKLNLDRVIKGSWIKDCLIDDIVRPNFTPQNVNDGKYLHVDPGYNPANEDICNGLAKESYVEVNLKTGIHFHF